LVFLQNPYDSTRPPEWSVRELVRAGHRLCYVPYAIEFGGNHEDVLYQFNMSLQQYGWAVFARSEAHRALFAEHCRAGNLHVHATGHPKFDPLCGGTEVAPDPGLLAFAAGRPLVMWNPHFDVRLNGTRFGDGYSTFLRWRDFIPAEFARRQDLAFVIRPHPTFFSALEHRGTYTREELDAFFRRCEDAGNIRIDRASAYYRVLSATDALISDGSSVLLEFGISGKPVCYLHNPNGPVAHLDYELDLDYLRQHTTWATTEEQIRSFLDRVAARQDDGREIRIAELRRRMGARPGGVGPEIKRVLEERLTAELAADAKAV
jgi:CDP-glycerol glycerophosphotransferase (TagB/SpsB family)